MHSFIGPIVPLTVNLHLERVFSSNVHGRENSSELLSNVPYPLNFRSFISSPGIPGLDKDFPEENISLISRKVLFLVSGMT